MVHVMLGIVAALAFPAHAGPEKHPAEAMSVEIDGARPLAGALVKAGWIATPEGSNRYQPGNIYTDAHSLWSARATCFDIEPRDSIYDELEVIHALRAGARIPLGLVTASAEGMRYKRLTYADPIVTELEGRSLKPNEDCALDLARHAAATGLSDWYVVQAVLLAVVSEQECTERATSVPLPTSEREAASVGEECSPGPVGQLGVGYKVRPMSTLQVGTATEPASPVAPTPQPADPNGSVSRSEGFDGTVDVGADLVENAFSGEALAGRLGPRPVPLASASKSERTSLTMLWFGCGRGTVGHCRRLGVMYDDGTGVMKDSTRAANLYEMACDAGVAEACDGLGTLYALGEGVTQDDSQAVSLHRLACAGGFAPGCNNLGLLYDNGAGVTQDNALAARLYKKACEGGSAEGCHSLGLIYDNADVDAQDAMRAAEAYKSACDLGSGAGCKRAIEMHRFACMGGNANGCLALAQSVTTSNDEAAELFRMACDDGSAQGCNNLGLAYDLGEGLPADNRRAAELYKVACDRGAAHGCNNLGVQYQFGTGVLKDSRRAANLYEMACDGGVAEACDALGTLYALGEGVAQDGSRAARLYKIACDGGVANACNLLGQAHDRLRGATIDATRAAELYKIACNLGHGEGCYNLGVMYAKGRGVSPDPVRASTYWKRACDLGNEHSCHKYSQ